MRMIGDRLEIPITLYPIYSITYTTVWCLRGGADVAAESRDEALEFLCAFLKEPAHQPKQNKHLDDIRFEVREEDIHETCFRADMKGVIYPL